MIQQMSLNLKKRVHPPQAEDQFPNLTPRVFFNTVSAVSLLVTGILRIENGLSLGMLYPFLLVKCSVYPLCRAAADSFSLKLP